MSLEGRLCAESQDFWIPRLRLNWQWHDLQRLARPAGVDQRFGEDDPEPRVFRLSKEGPPEPFHSTFTVAHPARDQPGDVLKQWRLVPFTEPLLDEGSSARNVASLKGGNRLGNG
jgi:hypothetical protein